MKKELLTIILILFSILLYGQNKIKGQLINEFGENGWAEIFLNNDSTKWMSYDGTIDLETSKKGLNEITFKYFGHFTTKIIIDCNKDITDLGKIHLIIGQFWLDGPKTGIIDELYDSGLLKYRIEIKKWRQHGVSEFYNIDGELTQKLHYKKGKLLRIFVRENGNMKELKFEFSKKGEIITIPNTA